MPEPNDAANNALLATLSESQVYRDYLRAFTHGTGLPLRLSAPEPNQVIRYDRKNDSPFCVLMAKTNQSCAACYAVQCKLEKEAQLEPKTLKCFAGLCETAVPIRVGNNLIAFLRTGQILIHRPDRAQFNKIARRLIAWGTEVNLKQAEEAYFNTRVLTKDQYDSLVRLLTIFAGHLASCANALMLTQGETEAPAIGRARQYIKDHSDDELSLGAVARVVNMSANYFSEKFKEATGINFVEFVARTRVEKARNLLQNPRLRVSEIAFDVGFQSLSQFNRTFKKVTGKAPGELRDSLVGQTAAV
jgi:AraC-like DNA-binding protein/ligand-binding sensor protein